MAWSFWFCPVAEGFVVVAPVPRSVFEDNEYPDVLEHPLRRLTATCLGGWHELEVGSTFRFSDENIQLHPQLDTSYTQWMEWAIANKTRHGFTKRLELFCTPCNRTRWMAPKGASNGT